MEKTIKRFFENRSMREFSRNFKEDNFLASVQGWYKEITLRSATLEYRWHPSYEEIRYTSGSQNTFGAIRKTKKRIGFLLCSAEQVYKWWKEPEIDTDSDLDDEDIHTQKLEQELEEAVSSSSSPLMKVFLLDKDEEDIKAPFKSKDVPTGYIPVAMAIEV